MSRDILSPSPLIRRMIYVASFIFARVIPKSMVLFVGYNAGIFTWIADKKGRKTVAENLRILMPQCSDSCIQRMVRKTYTNFALATAEMTILPRLKRHHFKNVRIIDPWQQMNELPVQGPLIAVSVHCNWEIMACSLHRLGYFKRCHAIALNHEDRVINGMFNELRESMGINSVMLDRAPLETLRTLKAGGILALIADRDYTAHGIAHQIGNGHMKIPVGPAALAIQTNAPILPVFTCRVGVCNYGIVFGKYIYPDSNLSKREQIPLILKQLAKTYERFLQAAPSQWVCFHQSFIENQDVDSTLNH